MKKKDIILNILTYMFSSVGIIILFSITIYIFVNGFKSLSWSLITSNYYDTVYTTKMSSTESYHVGDFEDPKIDNAYFSKNFGVSLRDGLNNNNDEVIEIVYIDPLSPFNHLEDSSGNIVKITTDEVINKIIITNDDEDYIVVIAKDKAKKR